MMELKRQPESPSLESPILQQVNKAWELSSSWLILIYSARINESLATTSEMTTASVGIDRDGEVLAQRKSQLIFRTGGAYRITLLLQYLVFVKRFCKIKEKQFHKTMVENCIEIGKQPT